MERISRYFFYIALAFIVYMPLHVFIVQSASLLTGGIEIWKAAKDVLLVLLVPILLYLSYRKGMFKNNTFRWLMILGGLYTLIHGLFVVFDSSDDTYSAIVGSVYNTRLLGYLLLGYVVGSAKSGAKYLKYILTATVLVATLVAVFGLAQYFLPSDLLSNVGYSLERGVKPLFFIDDDPNLPRVMSTLRDPNSLGAYLILPLLTTLYAAFRKPVNQALFIHPFQKNALIFMSLSMFFALILTFSRGALLGLVLSISALLILEKGHIAKNWLKKYWYIPLAGILLFGFGGYAVRNTAPVQDYVFHAAEEESAEDPNELRVSIAKDIVEHIVDAPIGEGPGSAGLVSIGNPKGTVLTENYYLQIAYEVGWLGLVLFLGILVFLIKNLQKICKLESSEKYLASILISSMVGYVFYSLLIHLWSNEALALQWWLIAGSCLGVVLKKEQRKQI